MPFLVYFRVILCAFGLLLGRFGGPRGTFGPLLGSFWGTWGSLGGVRLSVRFWARPFSPFFGLFEERFERPRTQGPPWEAPGAPRGRNGPPFLNFWNANAETSLVPSTSGGPDAQTSAPAARKSYAKSGFGPSTCSIPQGNKHIPLLRNVFSKNMIFGVPGPCSPPRPRQNTFFGET